MWTFPAAILALITVYILYKRINYLEKIIESGKEIRRLHIRPTEDFWQLPLIREAINLPTHGDLSKADHLKFAHWELEHRKVFNQSFTFFWDTELIFSSNDFGAAFMELPHQNQLLYSKELKTSGDE